ncbi:guanylate kinase [Caulobacter sp. NIBR1757]|uniref:guanylate kinase n=1 Tax=Caulobacter sp. NIBR1757 TaxID=3016000 RepID=UPI0022F047FE|nr:guanylate kinase [Caulobacter sp. NIBR1757]WGM39180.1 Guanylate kinase [Caulobacter sp. NIBR1757]
MLSEKLPTRGLLMMVVAPSGVGKTSLTRRLVADHSDLLLSISATTRDPRPGEHEGRDYHFVDRAEFDAMIDDNAFLEWAEVYGNRYGSPRKPIMDALERGESVLFDIDYQGAMSIHDQAPEDSVLVYILPPSLAEMSRRLHARSQDSEAVIAQRIARSKDEVEQWKTFDYVLLNEDFDKAYSDLAHIYHAERMKRARNLWIAPFVDELLKEDV